jgi:hypothetical protein
MNPDTPRTDLNDLYKAHRTNHNPSVRHSITLAIEELNTLRRATVELEERNRKLEARIEELEGIIDWHIDMVVGDAWLCRIEGKFEDIDRLLGDAVGKQIQSYEIDTQHFEESHDPAHPAPPAA